MSQLNKLQSSGDWSIAARPGISISSIGEDASIRLCLPLTIEAGISVDSPPHVAGGQARMYSQSMGLSRPLPIYGGISVHCGTNVAHSEGVESNTSSVSFRRSLAVVNGRISKGGWPSEAGGGTWMDSDSSSVRLSWSLAIVKAVRPAAIASGGESVTSDSRPLVLTVESVSIRRSLWCRVWGGESKG